MVQVEIVVLGIGGAFDADRGVANTGALLTVTRGKDVHRVLIDCGHTCGLQLHALGLTYEDIDAIALTHTHGDHIDGLETLGYKSLFLHQRRVPLFASVAVMERVWAALEPKMSPLQIEAGKSVPATLETYFDPRPSGRTAQLPGGITAQFLPVPHVAGMPSDAIILQVSGHTATIRWSGDCTFDAHSPLFANLQDGDLIFHDCAFYPRYDATVHTHLEELETLSTAVRQRVVLVHHGKVEQAPALYAGMRLGQPLERFALA
jgi:ribonuclease BN (tRNA processing enzyme)